MSNRQITDLPMAVAVDGTELLEAVQGGVSVRVQAKKFLDIGVGPTGATGPQGVPGSQGARGEQGLIGEPGPTGATGSRGPTGIQGATGPVGPAGETALLRGSFFNRLPSELPADGLIPQDWDGPGLPPAPVQMNPRDGLLYRGTGDPAHTDNIYLFVGSGGSEVDGWVNIGDVVGPTGATGPTGPQGDQGIQGERGFDGPEGPRGFEGPVGPQGNVGPTGNTGPQGVTGPTGADSTVPGPTGATGATGEKGDPGPTGAPGDEAIYAVTLKGDWTNWRDYREFAVANQLGWINFGNGRVIFDASSSKGPDLTTDVDNANPAQVWTPTSPTLMGWDGTSTYGVRVDSARRSDTSGRADSAAEADHATKADSATVAGRAHPVDASGNDWDLIWTGQPQMTYALASNDGVSVYPSNPSTWTVSRADTAGRADSAGYADNAGRAYPLRGDGNDINFNFSDQGQLQYAVTWADDAVNFYVSNPRTWSVSYADNAGGAGQATNSYNVNGTAGQLGFSAEADMTYGGRGGPEVTANGAGAAMMSFNRPGSFACNFGLNTNNQISIGGWSFGGQAWPVTTQIISGGDPDPGLGFEGTIWLKI